MNETLIEVTVNFYGVLEVYAGTRSRTLALPADATLQAALLRLVEINPPAYRDLINQHLDQEHFIRILLNEKMITGNLEIPLQHGDSLVLLPSISGG